MMNLERREADVVVVGGGPAGLSTAEKAAKSGANVLLFEKGNEIGRPVRTSGGSFIRHLERLGIPEDLYHPIHKVRVISPKNSATFEYDKPEECVIDVTGVYKFLAERATNAGAEIHLNAQVSGPIVRDGQVVGVTLKNENKTDIKSHVVVDATGYRASLMKQVNLDPGFERFGVGAEYNMIAPEYNQDEAVLVLGSQIAPSGYAWAFPWGEGRVRIGVGVIHPDSKEDPKQHLERFVQDAAKFGINLNRAFVNESHFGLIPSDILRKNIVGNGILSVGDSAGQSSTLIGEGIRWSIEAGNLAGNIVGKSIQGGNYTVEFLKRGYQNEWKSRHALKLKIAAAINKKASTFSDDQLDGSVELLKSLTPSEFSEVLQSEFKLHHGKLVLAAMQGVVQRSLSKVIPHG